MTKFNRSAVIDDLDSLLWRFLSPNAFVASSSLQNATESHGALVTEKAYRELLVVHLALSPVTAKMVEAAGQVIDRLPSVAGRRQVELDGEASGDINFARTFERRNETGTDTLFVCAQVQRRFESLHARILKTALVWCERIGRASSLADGRVSEQIGRHVSQATVVQQVRRVSRHLKLGGVRPLESPSEAQLERVQNRFGMGPVVEYIRFVRAVLEQRDATSIKRLFREVVLIPATDDRLFELAVGFKLVDALVGRGLEVQALQAVTGNRDPFAVLQKDGRRILLWDQRAPGLIPGVPSSISTYTTVRKLNGLSESSLRPDFVVMDEATGRILVVEVKLSHSDGRNQVRNGITDALAYLRDRPDLYEGRTFPHAVVISWNARTVPAPDAPIMVCSQDQIESIGNVIASWARPIAD